MKEKTTRKTGAQTATAFTKKNNSSEGAETNPDIQELKANIQTSLKHHKQFRDYSVKMYNYHEQMIVHLQDQLDQIDQIERSDNNE